MRTHLVRFGHLAHESPLPGYVPCGPASKNDPYMLHVVLRVPFFEGNPKANLNPFLGSPVLFGAVENSLT